MSENEWFLQLIRDGKSRTEAAEAFYQMLERRGEIRSHLVVTYRCPRRCLLAQVLRTNQGLIVHRARYKLSPGLNSQASSESGRSKNTEDGDRRWKASTFYLDQAVNVTLDCDHLRAAILEVPRIEADIKARHAEVVIR